MKYLFLILLPCLSFAKNIVPSSFTTSFEESLISKTTGKEKKSYGKIDYRYPGHIRYEVTSPNKTVFVSNGDKSWYYTAPFVEGEQGQVTIQRSSNLPLTKLLDSIHSEFETSKLFTRKFEGKKLILSFSAVAQKDLTLTQVILEGAKESKEALKLSDFSTMSLHRTNGQVSTLKFVDLKEEVTLPAQQFIFDVPPKTKVTGN